MPNISARYASGSLIDPALVAELARAELDDIIRLTLEVKTLTARIEERVGVVAPRCWPSPAAVGLTAAKIIGETAGVGSLP